MPLPSNEINDLLLLAFTTDGSGNVALRVVSGGLAADSVDATHIDWGTTGDEVSAADVPIADAGTYFTGTDVEAALQELGAAVGSAGAPTDATYIVQVPNGSLSNEQALSALATGILKNTTTTGVLSIATEGTDYYAPSGTDVAVADGGTGASSAGDARTNLGVAIGSDVQAWDADLDALAALAATGGMLSRTGAGTFAVRTITGTADRVTVTNGDGVSGAPTLDIASTYVGQNTITTLGTITTGVWNGTAIAVANGGTGAANAADARTNLGLAIGTNVQAYDADLDALAALATSGIVVRTGAGTAAIRDVAGTTNVITVTNGDGVAGNPTITIAATYVGQTSITTLGTITTGVWNGTAIAVANGGTGAANAGDARTNLGVAIGSDVQAWDADLDTWATKTAPSGVVLGTTDTQTLTNKRITPRVSSEASSATPTINTDNVDAHSITALAAAITSMTTNLSGTPTNFQKLIIRIKDNGTAREITWGASFEAKGVALPTTTVISKVLTVGFIYDTVTSKWGCVASAQEA